MKMKNVWYLFDDIQRQQLNAAGYTYTPAYLPALLRQMGVTARPCALHQIPTLGEQDILLIGAQTIEEIPANVGGVILLGSCLHQKITPPRREPVIYGFLEDEKARQLPLFVPLVQDSHLTYDEVLAWAQTDAGRVPALTKISPCVYHFHFDLAATIWYSEDGFEKDKPQHGFSIGRTPDTRPLPDGMDASDPYNDRILQMLQNILLSFGAPMLYTLPPLPDGRVPDFALHISGDDDHTSADFNRNAARHMHALGLPYHINLMAGRSMADGQENFVTSPEDLAELEALGCEVALHSDFTTAPYTAEGQEQECERFTRWFGQPPLTNTNHCFIQGGSTAERLRWLGACGIIADNCKLGEVDASDINAFNLCGFGFGTCFPRYTCDDVAHGNVLLPVMEIPITYYEPRLSGPEGENASPNSYADKEKITRYIDEAADGGRIIQFFLHPHYLATESNDRTWATAALQTAIQRWTDKAYLPLLTTTNRIARFWKARAEAEIKVDGTRVAVRCDHPLLLRLPYETDTVLVDASEVPVIHKQVDGHMVHLVPLHKPYTTVTLLPST